MFLVKKIGFNWTLKTDIFDSIKLMDTTHSEREVHACGGLNV